MQYVMAQEPCPNMTAEELRLQYADIKTEQELADAYAIAHNQFWCAADDIDDFEEGTEEYTKACEIADSWGAVMEEFENRIFKILRGEDIVIPDTGRIKVLIPFMERNGYFDGRGWWIKKQVSNKPR